MQRRNPLPVREQGWWCYTSAYALVGSSYSSAYALVRSRTISPFGPHLVNLVQLPTPAQPDRALAFGVPHHFVIDKTDLIR